MKGFSKTRIPNLRRNDASGIFYAVTRVGGGHAEVARSLHTDIESIAKIKLPAELAKIRSAGGKLRSGNLTLAECAEVYLSRRHTRKGKPLKPRSIAYREETVKAIRKTWPGFDAERAGLVTPARCQEWAQRARAAYGATRFNGMVESLRGIFQCALNAQAITANPMMTGPQSVSRASVPRKARFPISRDLFGTILQQLDKLPSRRFAALSLRALAFTGLRPNEAKHLTGADFDPQRGTLRARVTKNGLERTIELVPQAVELFESDLPGVLAALKRSPRKALASVCRDLKLPRLTPYDMRVMFSTRLDEAGVSVAIGARIMGHQDGGKVRLQHYMAHSEDFVKREMVKVRI